jgi:N-acetylglutamate synthase-like GNAT family acetyltransferase
MDYEISDDPSRLDIDAIHRWISEDSYWALGRSRETMERAISNSLCVGAFAPDGGQAAFARVITDRATFAYLCDVFVFPGHRGRGLGKLIVKAAIGHPALADVRNVLLATADAHGLYRAYGFDDVEQDRWMALRK